MSKYIYSLKLILLECVIPASWYSQYLPLARRMPLAEQELLTLSDHLSPSIIITGFVTRETGRIPQMVQELSTLPKHQSSLPGFSDVIITTTRSLRVHVCVCVCVRFLQYLPFSHISPSYLPVQLQVNWLNKLLQVPPLRHGTVWHSS